MAKHKNEAGRQDQGGDAVLLAALERLDWPAVLSFARAKAMEALAERCRLIREANDVLAVAAMYGHMGKMALVHTGMGIREAEKEVRGWQQSAESGV